jgi:hypothetical protein
MEPLPCQSRSLVTPSSVLLMSANQLSDLAKLGATGLGDKGVDAVNARRLNLEIGNSSQIFGRKKQERDRRRRDKDTETIAA